MKPRLEGVLNGRAEACADLVLAMGQRVRARGDRVIDVEHIERNCEGGWFVTERSAMEIVQDSYASLPPLRAAIQLIPVIGGSIDTLIVGRLGQIQAARMEDLVKKLAARLGGLERSRANLDSEAFSDLVVSTFEKAVRTRSFSKRARFANILAKQVADPREWEEAEAAVKLLAELEDIDVNVLRVALQAPPMHSPFEGLRVVSPAETRDRMRSEAGAIGNDPIFLPIALSEYTPLALRRAASDLLARGLLYDEGVGRLGTRAMEYLIATELAEWFASWIREDATKV